MFGAGPSEAEAFRNVIAANFSADEKPQGTSAGAASARSASVGANPKICAQANCQAIFDPVGKLRGFVFHIKTCRGEGRRGNLAGRPQGRASARESMAMHACRILGRYRAGRRVAYAAILWLKYAEPGGKYGRPAAVRGLEILLALNYRAL
eukprot:s895_g6.t1